MRSVCRYPHLSKKDSCSVDSTSRVEVQHPNFEDSNHWWLGSHVSLESIIDLLSVFEKVHAKRIIAMAF